MLLVGQRISMARRAPVSSSKGKDGAAHPATEGSYNLQAAMAALIRSGLSANVKLSGTAIVNGTSKPFTGTGTLRSRPACCIRPRDSCSVARFDCAALTHRPSLRRTGQYHARQFSASVVRGP